MAIYQKHPLKLAFIAAAAGILTIKYLLNKKRNRDIRKDKCILVIQSVEDWNDNEEKILKAFYESNVIGIDCEWVTDGSNRKPVSLLQLANSEGFCVLIRLLYIPVWLMPMALTELLKDRTVLKVGVGVNDDASKLFNDFCLEVQSFLDLRYLAKDLPELQDKSLGLKSLAKELLNYDLNKSFTLRCSDWDAETLTTDQIEYAADDAIISVKLFENIKSRKIGWLGFKSHFDEDVDMYVDIPFKQTCSNNNAVISKNTNKPGVMKYKNRYSISRQRPMYDNCQLVAPDGEVLCSCDKRKAEWYIDKGLGECIIKEPFTVRLNFEPSGRPKLDNIFYTLEKANCCVVCGKTENYHRKFIVPSEYRKYFPDLMKNNLSHDVLLLCVDCHKRSNMCDQKMRMKLTELCDAPMITSKNMKYTFNREVAKVMSAAKALIVSGEKIPDDRKKVLEKILMDYFKVTEVTEGVLHDAYTLDANIFNEAFVPHGLKVYEYFCKNGGLMQFEKLWRQHFLDTMQPKFLPTMWSIEHNHKRLAIQVINNEREVDFDISILGLDPNLIKEIELENKSQPIN